MIYRVHLHVTHIAPLLEAAVDSQLSSAEALARNQLDALSRSVVWDAQDLVEQNLLGTSSYAREPVGVRDEEGVVRSLGHVEAGKCGEALKGKVGLGDSEEKQQILGSTSTARNAHHRIGRDVDDNAALLVQASLLYSHPVVTRI